jgi:hypothetical protein
MLKQILLFGGLALILLFSACGGAGEETTTNAETTGLSESYADALPVAEQLALGSLLLEESEQAIDEAQAATLLPLWQAYQTLSTSDKTADAELDALVKQLQRAMTPAQIEAIAAMVLTTEDIAASAEELGGLFGRGAMRGSGVEGDGDAPFPGGGFGGGVPGSGMGGGPGAGGGFGAGVEIDPNARATRVAEMESDDTDVAGAIQNRFLVNALVRSLQVKTGAEVVPAGTGRFDQAFWNSISDAAGIPLETLQAALAEGTTLADAITAAGGDLEAVQDALRETYADSGAAQGDLEAWIENLLNNPMPQFGRPAAAETATPEP